MGSVIEKGRLFLEEMANKSEFLSALNLKLKNRKFRLYVGIFLVYFIAGFAFLAVGLQPVKSAEAVYATEAETAEEHLEIPAISLSTPVKISKLTGLDLSVPEQIAGSFSMHENKTFIFGHSSTVFANLKDLTKGDKITYQNNEYIISTIEEKAKNDIDMQDILKSEDSPTIVLMTCSGEKIEGTSGDHTHRIIITAKTTSEIANE